MSVIRDGRLVTATVTFTSTAPSGPPSILLGLTRGDTAGRPLGTFGPEVTLYMPPGSQQVKDTVDGALSYPFEGRLFGRPTITEVPLVSPGRPRRWCSATACPRADRDDASTRSKRAASDVVPSVNAK